MGKEQENISLGQESAEEIMLTPERLERLKSAGASRYDLNKAILLNNDLKEAMQALQEESTPTNRKNFSEAERAWAEYSQQLVDKYEAVEEEDSQFCTRQEALRYLAEIGCDVKKSKFYNDVGRPGGPKLYRGKLVSKFELEQYARTLNEKNIRGDEFTLVARADSLARREAADADIAEMKRDEMRRQQDAKWILRDTAYAQAAALVGALRDAVKHQMHHHQTELAQSVSGETERAPELFELSATLIDAAFNEVCRQPLSGELVAEDGEEEQVEVATK